MKTSRKIITEERVIKNRFYFFRYLGLDVIYLAVYFQKLIVRPSFSITRMHET